MGVGRGGHGEFLGGTVAGVVAGVSLSGGPTFLNSLIVADHRHVVGPIQEDVELCRTPVSSTMAAVRPGVASISGSRSILKLLAQADFRWLFHRLQEALGAGVSRIGFGKGQRS